MNSKKKFTMLLIVILTIVMLLNMFSNISVSAENKDNSTTDVERISDLLLANNINYNPKEQTLIVIKSNAKQKDHLKALNIYEVEKRISEYQMPFHIVINGNELKKGDIYYVVSLKDSSVKKMTIDYEALAKVSSNLDEYSVCVVDKGTSYKVYSNIDDYYYTDSRDWTDENGNYYNGGRFTCRPTSNKAIEEYSGIASEIVETEFSYQWDLESFMDIEIWSIDTVNKAIDYIGFLDKEGYINFKVELRDASGNVSLLPRSFFNNYGNYNNYIYMEEDGIISIPIEKYGSSGEEKDLYGEFDFYIPFGYDYRMTLLSYSVETFGQYAYYYDQEHIVDENQFWITNKSLIKEDGVKWEWGSFIEFTFMPLSKQIKIEKEATGAEDDQVYKFQITQLVPSFYELYINYVTDYHKGENLNQLLIDYPCKIYDGNSLISTKTDENGCLYLKAGQYATIDVWQLPVDFENYMGSGMNIKDIYDQLFKDISSESSFIVEELESSNCSTTIEHESTRFGNRTIKGKIVEDVYGGDTIRYLNDYNVGSLEIKKIVEGIETEESFEFEITLSDTSINGQYGEIEFVDGKTTVSLKAEECLTAENLPANIEYQVVEIKANQNGFKTTSTNASGKIIKGETIKVEFINKKGKVPSTGDSVNVAMLLTISSGCAIALCYLTKKKKMIQ